MNKKEGNGKKRKKLIKKGLSHIYIYMYIYIDITKKQFGRQRILK